MVRLGLSAIALLATAVYAPEALAGPYANDIAKCFVQSSSIDDKTVFVKWMFAELSLNPSVQSLSSITDEQRDALTRKAVEYYQRLLFVDCRQPTVDALKYEGPGALVFGFSIIGQVAARELMNNPKTQAGMAAMSAAVDKEKLAELLKDAGLPAPAGTAQPTK
jgi:hypothetical protein